MCHIRVISDYGSESTATLLAVHPSADIEVVNAKRG